MLLADPAAMDAYLRRVQAEIDKVRTDAGAELAPAAGAARTPSVGPWTGVRPGTERSAAPANEAPSAGSGETCVPVSSPPDG
ncbi:hypothetical protein BKE56_006670 [Rhodococcus sp. M8]|nr:hypothetical protein BKE56_006670 [Rhodococcus sp. M8]